MGRSGGLKEGIGWEWGCNNNWLAKRAMGGSSSGAEKVDRGEGGDPQCRGSVGRQGCGKVLGRMM